MGTFYAARWLTAPGNVGVTAIGVAYSKATWTERGAHMQTTDHHELMEMERQFWNAMQSKDGTAAGKMTDDGCVIVGAQGVSAIDAATMSRLTADGTWQIREFSFDDKTLQARRITDDVCVVAYKVKEELTVEGKPLTLEANDASVWVKRDGRWLCALHTESVAGDPFGRQ